MLTVIAKILKVLNSESEPFAIGSAVSLAFCFALLPVFSLLKWLVLVIVIMTRVNLSIFLVFSVVFGLLALLVDPLLNGVGEWLILTPGLEMVRQTLANSDVTAAFAIDNTLGLGSLVICVGLFLPLLFAVKVSVVAYREKWMAKVEQWHLVKIFKASKLFQIYQSLT